jgi:hypothetical protein
MEVPFDQVDTGFFGGFTDCTATDRIATAESVSRVNATPRKDHH